MDSLAAHRFRERWQAVAAIEAAEQQATTIEARWRQTNSILGMALALGLDLTHREDEENTVRMRWMKRKEAI